MELVRIATEILAPALPEGDTDGAVVRWFRQAGDAVGRGDLLAEVETEKVVMEVVAPADGVLGEIVGRRGDTVVSGEVPGSIV
ncbi:biotin/lipoyl-containing protein [Embleya sp. MST-111070]|uniref:biotin/lipoyl-containing protein n=1 Tax=Embleya sp. MST-111070 TaxID=3398231 RepID=UPI003F73492C